MPDRTHDPIVPTRASLVVVGDSLIVDAVAPCEQAKPVLRSADALPASVRRQLKPSTAVRSRLTRRTFVYARYSTDGQEVKSEERQIADCKAYSGRKGFEVVRIFSDRGKSGTGMAARLQLQAMMAAARRREVDVVVVEDLDRLSRSLPDLMAIFYELRLLGIELHDIQTGKLDLVHVVIRGYMGEEGRVRFLALSKAGKQRAVREGKVMHKVHYGHRRDPDQVGVHHKDPETMAHLLWIYKVVADGMSAGMAARDLTLRGVPPPAQAARLAAGGKIAKVKSWQPNTIIKLVRSTTPLGLVSWGKSHPVHDPLSRRRTGYEATEESCWIVVEHPDLRIVDDETWTRANLRLSSLAYPTAKAYTRFLLTGKAHCRCGAVLKATAGEYATKYVCSARKLAGPTACSVDEYHRLDWVERAVLGTVLASVLRADRLDDYATEFQREIEKILKDDVRESARIRRRLSEIDDLQMKSFCNEPANGLVPARVAKIRRSLEDEAERLEAELGGLRNPSDFSVPLNALNGVSGDLARMLEEVPFRPNDAEGVAMAQAVRNAIDTVVVHPADDAGFTRIVVRVDFLQSLRVEGKVASDVPEAFGTVDLETGFTAAVLRRAEREARIVKGEASMLEAARDGCHDLSDHDWAIVRPILRDVDLEDGGALVPRKVFDGMILHTKEGGALGRIPAHYGEPGPFRRAVKRLVYSGRWDDAVDALRAADAACLAGARVERFNTTEYPRRNVGARPEGDAAAIDRATLLRLAAAEPDGDPVALRCELVARVLAGAPIARTAKALGMSSASAYHFWDDYKADGVDVLRRKPPSSKATFLDEGQIAELRKVAEAGIDPVDEGKWVTYPILVRVCEERFGIAYSVPGMSQLATRNGFPLRPLVARARRARILNDDMPLPPAMPPMAGSARRAAPASKAARRAAAGAGRAPMRGPALKPVDGGAGSRNG